MGRQDRFVGGFRGAASVLPRPVTLCLLVADAVVIGVYVVLTLFLAADAIEAIPKLWRIDRDWGLGEMFNYAKWIALAAIALLLFRQQGALIFLGIAFLSVVALFDDSLQLHERFEYAVVPALAPNLLRGMGEMLFVAAEGLVILALMVAGWIRAHAILRKQVFVLVVLLGSAVFCAVVVDFVHVHASANRIMDAVLGILEDGGEMIFLSLAVSYAAGLLLDRRARR